MTDINKELKCPNVFKDCCCSCVHQKILHAHPWNKGLGKGPISLKIGWICDAPIKKDHVVYFDFEHGSCELHIYKHNRKNHAPVWGEVWSINIGDSIHIQNASQDRFCKAAYNRKKLHGEIYESQKTGDGLRIKRLK